MSALKSFARSRLRVPEGELSQTTRRAACREPRPPLVCSVQFGL